jgi:hypothetical protein
MPEGVPLDRTIELLLQRMKESAPEEVIKLLSSVSSERELILKIGPVFDRLPRQMQQEVILRLHEMRANGLELSFKVGAQATLHDLNTILSLNEEQLKAITIATAHFLASDEQERTRLIDPHAFIAAADHPQGAGANKTAIRLITCYYLHHLTLPATDIVLFSHPVHAVTMPFDPAAVRRATIAAHYTPQDIKRICRGLHTEISEAIEETYASLGRSLKLRSTFTKAAIRLSSRGLAWLLLVVMLSDFHFPSFSGWFRKTSREYERAAIEQVYDRYQRTVAGVTAQQFSSIPVETFNQEKAALQQALAEQHAAHQDVVANFRGVIVAPGENVNEEIKKVIEDEKVLEGVRNIVQRWWESLAGRIQGITQWTEFALNERQGFERDVYAAIDQLFKDRQFLVALEKDKQSGIIEVNVSSSWIGKYTDRGLYWTVNTTKDAAKWAADKSLATLLSAIGDLFKEAGNFVYGTVLRNEQKLDEARQYFARLAALTGGLGAVLMLLFLFLGPWMVAITLIADAIVKWSIKGGMLFYKVMISGAIKDIMVITGTIRISSMAEPIESAQTSVEQESLVDRVLHR